MRRRDFLKLTVAGVAGLAARAVRGADRPPNVVLIFIDDMGWRDAGFAGSDLYETPNIDRLSREGMVFTNAYSGAGNCAPSRACLLSGQYTPRHGVYAVGNTSRGPKNRMRLVPVPNTGHLAAENVTLAEAMAGAGYATGMFGKWHLGGQPGTEPQEQGFGTTDSMAPPRDAQFKQSDDPKWIYRITEGACQFMEANRDRPFFAYVAHHATHMGIQAREDTYRRFEAKGPGERHQHVRYAAMNAQMDDGVGVLLRKLDELGLAQHTLVFFTSDNGGLPQSPQTPLRGFKGMYYEGGIRVPMVARLPGTVTAGSTCDVPVHNVDLYPTFLDAAGAKPPPEKVLDGESLMPLLRQTGPLKREAIFWHFPGYLDNANPGARDPDFRTRPVTVIRKGDWKLHLFHEEWVLDGGRQTVDTNNALELYDLGSDVGESRNLAASRKDKRDELLTDLLAWLDATRAPMPTEANPGYNPDAAPRGRRRGG